jgi:uncharacterized protein YggU (UPF0235/DUF167 family)
MECHVHVHPGARAAFVGGDYDGALVVRVRARAVDGAASNEVLTVVAEAFHVPHTSVHLIRGVTSRRKVLRIEGEDDALNRQLSLLLGSDSK